MLQYQLMDIFSHGLWTGAAYKALNKKKGYKFNIFRAIWWGVFPDLFAFTIPMIWLIFNLISGGFIVSDLPRPNIEPAPQDTLPIFRLTSLLYSISHSALVFILILGIILAIRRQPVWEMGGWLMHILIDIPTHSYRFYPTPFLWPVSQWKFNGFSWSTSWFLILDYSLIVVTYFLLYRKRGSAN